MARSLCLVVPALLAVLLGSCTRKLETEPAIASAKNSDIWECRKARIAALRLPFLRGVWASLLVETRVSQAIEQRIKEVAGTCSSQDREHVGEHLQAIRNLTGLAVSQLAARTRLTHAEATFALEDKMRRASQLLIERCTTSDAQSALTMRSSEFDLKLGAIALGQCSGTAPPWDDEGGYQDAPGAAAFAASMRSCMEGFWNAVERRSAQQCGGGAAGGGLMAGNVTTETHSYADEDGNEHLAIVETTESGDVKVTEISCSGKCQADGEGDFKNVESKDTTIVTQNDDGSQYVTNIDKDGNVTGRPWGDGSADIIDATGSPDPESAKKKAFEDCLFSGGQNCGSPFECLVTAISPGLDLMYTASASEAGSVYSLLPPNATDAFGSCLCNQARDTVADPIGILPAISCESDGHEQRMDCLRMPFAPDDAPRPECMKLAEQDAQRVAQQDPKCKVLECPANHYLTRIGVPGSEECGCASRGFVAERLQGLRSPQCAAMTCVEGTCTCQGAVCTCRSDALDVRGPGFGDLTQIRPGDVPP